MVVCSVSLYYLFGPSFLKISTARLTFDLYQIPRWIFQLNTWACQSWLWGVFWMLVLISCLCLLIIRFGSLKKRTQGDTRNMKGSKLLSREEINEVISLILSSRSIKRQCGPCGRPDSRPWTGQGTENRRNHWSKVPRRWCNKASFSLNTEF